MPEAYFNIPLPNKAGLVEMQDYLKKHLSDGAQYQDPATFHVTLVYAQDTAGADLRTINWPETLPIFGISGQYLEVWDTQEGGQVIVLRVNGGPHLRALQTVLFYEAWSRGVTLSQFSYPQDWRPHITLATMPSGLLASGYLDISSTFATQVGRFVLTAEGYEEVASFDLSTTGPGGQILSEHTMRAEAVREQLRQADGRYRIQDVLTVTAFRGTMGEDYPDVQTSDQVDVAALTKGDPDPFYVTLKIAQSGVMSGNGVFYGEEDVNILVQQTREKRPTGGRGHLRNDEVDSALPANPAHWIGVTRVGEFVWGKAYVAPGETRDWLSRLGATRSKVATSIFGFADELVWDEEREAFRLKNFDLEYIDFASAERAGVPSLAGLVHITTEMTGDKPPDKESEMDKLEVIRQMTAEDIKLLPDTVVAAVIAQSEPAKVLPGLTAQITELRSVLGLEDGANVVEAVKTLHTQVNEQRAAVVSATISELINDQETGVKVETVKPVVLELVKAEKPDTVEQAKAVFEQVMGRESVKALLKTAVIGESGPQQRRPASPDGTEDPADKYFPVRK